MTTKGIVLEMTDPAWVALRAGEDAAMAQIGWSGAGDAAVVVIGGVPACGFARGPDIDQHGCARR